MPKSYTVAEIKDLDADEIVHKFTGTIKRIWDTNKTATGATFQNIIVEDRDGDEIKVTLKNCDELEFKEWKNKEITILAHQGRDDEWSGAYANDNKYQGKTTRILLVTDTAEIVEGGSAKNGKRRDEDEDDHRSSRGNRDEECREESDERSERRSRRDRDEDEGDDRRERRNGRDDDDLDRAKEKIVKLGNLMHLCSGMGVDIGRAFESTFNMHLNEVFKEGLGSHIHTLFIQATREGLHNLMPAEPLYELPDEDKDKEKETKKSAKGK